jgi:glutathione synthase/RimK-type ligase-like ATP-grasp enzyme
MSDSQSHPNTRAVRTACDRLGIPYHIHDTHGNFVSVDLEPVRFFVNSSVPFNNGAVDKICKDKEFTWKLLKDVVRTPRTKGYFDPFPQDPQYVGYVVEPSYDAITDSILREFSTPMIVKMNSGSLGKNVYLCTDRAEIQTAVTRIFDHHAPSSDYVVLAQEYIPSKKEYRALVFRKKIVLLYEKDISEATFTGNLSPLHYENAHARLVEDESFIRKAEVAISGIFPVLDLEFGGIDLIEDNSGELHVIELNTQPGLAYFVKDNGDEPIVRMYEGILGQLQS